ncbi:DUF2339 domain-containing protein [Fulvivirga ulvae]|uniref:DUF2339 domain-containing protein n=1 Tax=Fulvivirga ulvae TaxID=2904245 RepID=UPI001F2D1FDC|nr:DUF2339 domain-containing protein [Fulvivirga ulvae]UII30004.1 DUF2339 domain-containing protein [Fulvivirga ulvae]
MPDNQEKIDELLEKLETLLFRQQQFKTEIDQLRSEIYKLKGTHAPKEERPFVAELTSPKPATEPVKAAAEEKKKVSISQAAISKALPNAKSDFEKFIGENLISKIGIAITVFGVAVGAKYAIDNQLISPLTRIILGYLIGGGLLALAFKLKPKYENFSAVLLSGAMAIMYFITFAAYSFYELFPQSVAFVLMVVFTAFTVFAALQYNRPVIAHIGLVGAYAVPFLLSDGSGKAGALFAYIAIINSGILLVAIKKYWKSLYYAAFVLTWLIYSVWYLDRYTQEYFSLAFIFLSIYFIIFYIAFLSYKLIRKEKYGKGDVVLLLLNSFIFYAFGFDTLQSTEVGKHLVGLFSLGNGVIHAMVSYVIYRKQQADKNLFYMAVGLVMVFVTISVPVQLDGNWVTLLWVGEATLLFWIGRSKNVPIYEKLSYPLMALAFVSLLHDWSENYENYYYDDSGVRTAFLWNINFLTSILFAGAFGFITYLNARVPLQENFTDKRGVFKIIRYVIPAIFLITLYNAFQIEIANYWDQLFMDSEVQAEIYQRNFALEFFKSIWVLNYTMLFLSVLSLTNIRKVRNKVLAYINIVFNLFVLLVFLTQGLLALSELREFYIDQSLAEYYSRGPFYIGIRYVSFAFVALLMFSIYSYMKSFFTAADFKRAFYLILHITILWVISSELISGMDLAGSTQSYKLGLSILWGLYAVLLIILGIIKRQKYLRIAAIALFGVTLIKLFLYDLAALDTIGKTIVLVSLGVLLLLISFLYNKYKHVISDEIQN